MSKIAPIDIDSQNVPSNVQNFATQVKKAFLDIAQHLLNLSPQDNFRGFLFEGTISATTETKITNRLPKVPTGYLVLFCKGGNIQAGDTAWTSDFVYLKNAGASAITVKVFFFI